MSGLGLPHNEAQKTLTKMAQLEALLVKTRDSIPSELPESEAERKALAAKLQSLMNQQADQIETIDCKLAESRIFSIIATGNEDKVKTFLRLNKAFDVNEVDSTMNMSAFAFAAHKNQVGMLRLMNQAHGGAVNTSSKTKSPLHYAAKAGSLQAAKWLQGQGAKINHVDDEGNTPIEAAKKEDESMRKWLASVGGKKATEIGTDKNKAKAKKKQIKSLGEKNRILILNIFEVQPPESIAAAIRTIKTMTKFTYSEAQVESFLKKYKVNIVPLNQDTTTSSSNQDTTTSSSAQNSKQTSYSTADID